jgi:hypothetical protein
MPGGCVGGAGLPHGSLTGFPRGKDLAIPQCEGQGDDEREAHERQQPPGDSPCRDQTLHQQPDFQSQHLQPQDHLRVLLIIYSLARREEAPATEPPPDEEVEVPGD